jgi:hypothetical protein
LHAGGRRFDPAWLHQQKKGMQLHTFFLFFFLFFFTRTLAAWNGSPSC